MSNETHSQDTADTVDHGSDNMVTIIVNGQEKLVKKGKITYEAVVGLAYGDTPPPADTWDITVTYRRGQAPHSQGELEPGESVMVVQKMIFNVTATKKS